MTKKQALYTIQSYQNNRITLLHINDCYVKPSIYKNAIYKRLEDEALKIGLLFNDYNYMSGISSYNGFMFTFMTFYEDNDNIYLRYETKTQIKTFKYNKTSQTIKKINNIIFNFNNDIIGGL